MIKKALLSLLLLFSFGSIMLAWLFVFPPKIDNSISGHIALPEMPSIDTYDLKEASQNLSQIVKSNQIKRMSPEITKTRQNLSITVKQISFREDATWVFCEVNNQSTGAVKLPETIFALQNEKFQAEIQKNNQEDLPLARTIPPQEIVQGVVYLPALATNQDIAIFLEGIFVNDQKNNFVFNIRQ